MSTVPVNDENRGPEGELFSILQPTGRQSILRQTENLPSKTLPKGGKVCFQTPRRDPVSNRIVSPSMAVKMASLNDCMKAMDSRMSTQEGTETFAGQHNDASSLPGDEMPIKSKGGYLLDFDNLDTMDPFQCSNNMLLSPARPAFEELPVQQNKPEPEPENIDIEAVEVTLDSTLPFNPSVDNSLADLSIDMCSTESSIVTVMKNLCIEDQESSMATPDKQPAAAVSLNYTAAAASADDSPLPGRGAYSLDLDNLDTVNPFQTGGSKINNSPALCRTQPGNQPEVSSVKTTDPENVPVDVPEALKEAPVQPEAKPVAMVAPISNDVTHAPDSEEVQGKPTEYPAKGGPVKLEFGFDDGAEVKRKLPPKKFGKRLPASEKKPAAEKQLEPPKEPTVLPTDAEVETPLPKTTYSFDMLDDPNFNPFGTNVKMVSSPACKVPPAGEKMAMPEPTSEQAENQTVVLCAGGDVTDTEASTAHGQILHQEEPMSLPAPDLALKLEAECRTATPEPADLTQDVCNQTIVVEPSEEFVPGATFNDFDGQFDYLEQFGSTNFKDSALRKQSLYLKFDPLLRESPKKAGAPAVHVNPPRPSAFGSRLGSAQTVHQPPTMDNMDAASAAPIVEPLIQNVAMLECLVPPTNTEDAIIEVLKYSQKDMDAAIARVKAEAVEKEAKCTLQYDKQQEDNQEMRKIVSEFELTIKKITADRKEEAARAVAKLNEALAEKEQVSGDLNAMESAFSDLFKRLEKYKRMMDSYKKNEETMKGCVQEYLARIKKEGQRYQTLKAYAEEKITKANEEIGEERSKLKAEVMALELQLRRAQLKCQSLERNYEQKAQEAQEMGNLCEELIAKVRPG